MRKEGRNRKSTKKVNKRECVSIEIKSQIYPHMIAVVNVDESFSIEAISAFLPLNV